MNKYLPFLILAFLLILIAISTYNLNKKQTQKLPSNSTELGIHFAEAEIVLPDFSLPTLNSDTEKFSKKDLAKKKYSMVNFFASWCTTCRAEHEVLLKLQKSKIVDIYGVAWHDIASNSANYLEQNGNPFIKVALDSKGTLGRIANIQAIPETWLVDQQGVVRWVFRGNLQDFSVDEIRTIVLE